MGNEKMLNGAQKLQALEKAVADMADRHDKQMAIVADEINKLNDVLVALAKRLNAIVKAGESATGINSDSVKDVMTAETAKELKGKVDMLVEQGLLVRNDDKVIDDDTFVVGREEDSEGKEINPRTQFLVKALHKDVAKLILGKKAGDSIANDEIKQVMFITETYDITQANQIKEEAEETPAVAEEQAAGAQVMRTKTKRSKAV